jgi:hypothetical protein
MPCWSLSLLMRRPNTLTVGLCGISAIPSVPSPASRSVCSEMKMPLPPVILSSSLRTTRQSRSFLHCVEPLVLVNFSSFYSSCVVSAITNTQVAINIPTFFDLFKMLRVVNRTPSLKFEGVLARIGSDML